MKPIFEPILLWFADDSVVGDLLEEFREERLPKWGPIRAELWFARQVVSIAWHGTPNGFISLCLLSMLCSAWLMLMEVTLLHTGFYSRSFEDFLFLMQAVLGLLAVSARRAESLRSITWGLTGIAFFNAITALVENVTSSHFEGYTLLCGTLFLAQSVVTTILLRHRAVRQ